ncbi:TonB-dependent receptor [Sphingobacterium alkalisoli]|uniref:TonB-dependent receptor n=1 Tax=Sphingobacterium alkalisoli TaxID=1874115 RepID=A0A4U0GUT4_9SPHI|nr:TonB-dependent receptor [Sphingobacterium alkalisoli]TJY62656.1 TonB-dependent receptor [Sphingobacterium alkalisoli]GGH28027.1 collagen-binding protein [Sphingobacterium alkalisoli]
MRYFLLVFTALFLSISAIAQEKITISGYVKDAASGEVLIGAVVQIKGTQSVTSTNNYGYYALQVAEPSVELFVSFVGYQVLEQSVNVTENKRYNFELVSLENQLEEVVVSMKKQNDNVTNAQMGAFNFTMEEVKNIPVVFGERDILKTIQLLPGIGKGGEGSSNFYVRGGGSDQNLILLDEATVYNAAHLLGFFSTFNSDAIKDVELYKGGVPAQYGGRVSSVMDINMVDGNNKKFAAEGGLGLIASRLKLEGPIVKDKGSFMISGRRTYADLFLKLSNDETVNQSKLYFYDLNAKVNYRFNDKNTLYASGYFGKDDLGYGKLFSFDWGNATATVRWNHIFNEKLFSNTSLIYSDFTYNVNVSNNDRDFTIASKIENFNLKEDLSYYANNNNTLRFGINLLRQKISPASLNAGEESSVNSIDIESRSGIEAAAYISHEWKPSSWLSMIYGLRATDFMVQGPGTFYEYDEDGDPIGEQSFDGGVIKHYFNLEPRLSLSVILNSEHSVKISYNRIAQNLHQLTNTTSSLPTDQYVVSSLNIKPQFADQAAIGYFRNFGNNAYEFSVEGYYKFMDNQIDFRNGADLQANKYLEGELLYGIGRSYGLEWYLRKSKGKLNGWISYTLAKSERQFEQINDGDWFNARQDRTHDISVVGMYELSKKWSLGATFLYYTGNAITFPSGKYQVDGRTLFYYTERNGYRMPDYHRLDLSATYEPKKENKRFHSSWSFGLYNAYNRRNAYIIDFRENEDNANVTEAYKVALFGIIPSVTWNFKF